MDSLVNYTEPNYIGRFAHESAYVGQGACLIDDTHLIRYAQKSGTDKWNLVPFPCSGTGT